MLRAQSKVQLLKPNGLFAFTCTSTGRGEHRTLRTGKYCSYRTLVNTEDIKRLRQKFHYGGCYGSYQSGFVQ